MNAKTYQLCEAVADLAESFATPTRAPVRPGNSRDVVSLVIEWAEEFEKAHKAEALDGWTQRDYIGTIDAWFASKYADWRAAEALHEESDTVRVAPEWKVETATAGD